jgi:hypothetical protein
MTVEEKKQARIERSDEVRRRINVALSEILSDRDWPESVRPIAEKEWCELAVRAVREQRLPKMWAGSFFREQVHGAMSSLEVLMRERAQFRNRKGKLVDAEGNLDWVLDCWEVALEAWDNRQLRLEVQ